MDIHETSKPLIGYVGSKQKDALCARLFIVKELQGKPPDDLSTTDHTAVRHPHSRRADAVLRGPRCIWGILRCACDRYSSGENGGWEDGDRGGKTVKVKLLFDIPVHPEHGLTKDRVLDVIEVAPGRRSSGLEPKRGENDDTIWVMGDTGEKVKLNRNEFEVVDG